MLAYPLLHTEDSGIAEVLRDEFPPVKLLVLAARGDAPTLRACVEAGAVGIVGWDQPPAELAVAIHRVRAGETLFDATALLRLLAGPPQPRPGEMPARSRTVLTPREREVLELLAAGLGTTRIAERLIVSPHTARSHLRRVMRKLGARSRFEAVLLAARAGLDEAGGVTDRA